MLCEPLLNFVLVSTKLPFVKYIALLRQVMRLTLLGYCDEVLCLCLLNTEFMKLTQGNKSLNEYLQAFNNLVRYALEFVDTDANKIASFKRGLSPKLMKSMGNSKCTTFNEFISDALTQEDNDAIYAASKSHKRNYEAGASQSKAPVVAKTQYHPSAANIRYRPPQKKNQAKTGFCKGYTIALPKNTSRQGSSNAPPANVPC